MSNNDKKTIRLRTYYLPDNLHQTLKLIALYGGGTVSDLVSKVLMEYVAQYTLENPQFDAVLNQNFLTKKNNKNKM